MNTNTLLKFGAGNGKVGKLVHTFTLPAGYTCPGARDCLSRLNRSTGRIQDGPETKFRCFAASLEARPSVRKVADHNFALLKACGSDTTQMVKLIEASLPSGVLVIRVHVGGDFFSYAYFCAWMTVAARNRHIRFYSYTKSLHFWTQYQREGAQIPDNFALTASQGGKFDALVTTSFKTSTVVFSEAEAANLGLEIDHDDSHAYAGPTSFALLIHGNQPKGSAASHALHALAT